LFVDFANIAKIEGEGKEGPNCVFLANWLWRSGSGALGTVVEVPVLVTKDQFGKDYLSNYSRLVVEVHLAPEKMTWDVLIREKDIVFVFNTPNDSKNVIDPKVGEKKLNALITPAAQFSLDFKRLHHTIINSKEYKEKAEGKLKALGIELVVNWDGIGHITGKDEKEGDHNVHLLNFIHRSGSGVLYTVVDTFGVIAKDDFGKQYLKAKVAKVVVNLTHSDKFTHEYVVKDNECVVNLTAPIGCKNVTDASKAAVIIEEQLTPASDNIPLTYLREKKIITESPDYKKLMDRATKLGIAYEIGWDHLASLTGKSVHYMQKHELAASTAYAQYIWRSGSGIAKDAVDVLEAVMKDDLGKQAFKAKYDKVVSIVGPGEKFETKLVTDGKTLKFETCTPLPSSFGLNTKNLIAELTKSL